MRAGLFSFLAVLLASQTALAKPLARVSPDAPATAQQEIQATLRLSDAEGMPLSEDRLNVVHTQKVHLLVIDPTLTDYHHLHPTPTDEPGVYAFRFTPALSGNYRMWADVTPREGAHVYLPADMGQPPAHATPERAERLEARAEGMDAVLTLDAPLAPGKASLATVRFTRKGAPVNTLEPVMGAFAHMVGFMDDFQNILHVHPMGQEPEQDSERGGPVLTFHIEPKKAGFVRLFVQIRQQGKDIFFPFGLLAQ